MFNALGIATPNESSTLSDLLGIEKEEVDYNSDVEFKASTSVQDDISRKAPNTFPERGAVDALSALHTTPGMGSANITNPLDEEQEQALQQRESAQRRYQIMVTLKSHNESIFTTLSVEGLLRQTLGEPLASWIITAVAATTEEVEAGRVLRESYLVP